MFSFAKRSLLIAGLILSASPAMAVVVTLQGSTTWNTGTVYGTSLVFTPGSIVLSQAS